MQISYSLAKGAVDAAKCEGQHLNLVSNCGTHVMPYMVEGGVLHATKWHRFEDGRKQFVGTAYGTAVGDLKGELLNLIGAK